MIFELVYTINRFAPLGINLSIDAALMCTSLVCLAFIFSLCLMFTNKQLSTAIFGATFTVLAIGGAAQAALLGTENFDTGLGTNDFPSDNYEVNVRIAPGSLTMKTYSIFDPSYPTLFKGTLINPGNVGQTFTATANDPAFNDFAARLTNKQINSIGLIFGLPNPETSREGAGTLYASRNKAGFGNYPDLSGSIIDSISLQINSLTVEPVEAGRERAGGNFTLSVFGQLPNISQPVPEPAATLGLLAFGVLGAGSRVKLSR